MRTPPRPPESKVTSTSHPCWPGCTGRLPRPMSRSATKRYPRRAAAARIGTTPCSRPSAGGKAIKPPATTCTTASNHTYPGYGAPRTTSTGPASSMLAPAATPTATCDLHRHRLGRPHRTGRRHLQRQRPPVARWEALGGDANLTPTIRLRKAHQARRPTLTSCSSPSNRVSVLASLARPAGCTCAARLGDGVAPVLDPFLGRNVPTFGCWKQTVDQVCVIGPLTLLPRVAVLRLGGFRH